MHLRFSLVRVIARRSCALALIVILLVQIVVFFNHDNAQTSPTEESLANDFSSEDRLFWSRIEEEDRDLTDEQRQAQLTSNGREQTDRVLNWTTIFWDVYQGKLATLNERDEKTAYKRRTLEDRPRSSQTTIDIYEETLVFDRPKFCSSTRIFHPQCPYSNCRWTCKEPTISTGNTRRASIFHHVDIKREEMQQKLKHRSPNDIWILWVDEANRPLQELNQYRFNWTLSFRQDSEVSIGSYGLLIRKPVSRPKSARPEPNSIDPSLVKFLANQNVRIANVELENRIYTNYRYRRRQALWFVSNCEPKRRLAYYRQLKRFYPVDAFGSCVEKKCDKLQACEREQSSLALFYLAFESQTCTDYITEKFWRAISSGLIPIVLGPGKQSYLDLNVPESAFIHVDDFASARDLATHLHRIENNYLLYRAHFQWLNQYDVVYDINVLEPIRMCELCMRLNEQKWQDHRYYSDMHQWHRAGC